MMDKIISEDLEKIKSTVKRDAFAGKKVLVTGGAGFIGSWLCDVLVGFGAEVTAVDDLSTGRIKNIDHLTKNPLFKFVKSDVCAFESKEKFDFIFHMAGHASPDEYQTHPIETLQTSALGSFAMAELPEKMMQHCCLLQPLKFMVTQKLFLHLKVTGEKSTRLDQDLVMTKENVSLKLCLWLIVSSTGWMSEFQESSILMVHAYGKMACMGGLCHVLFCKR